MRNLIPDFIFNRTQKTEVAQEFFRQPYTRQILVFWSVAEPSAHLKKRVIRIALTHEVADYKTFQRNTARKSVSPNDDYGMWIFLIIIQSFLSGTGTVIDNDLQILFVNNIQDFRPQGFKFWKQIIFFP